MTVSLDRATSRLAFVLAAMVLLAPMSRLEAQSTSSDSGRGREQTPPTEPLSGARVDKSIRDGLAFLAKRQDPGTGRFAQHYPVAVTALGGMAFLGAGAEYNRGPYGDNLSRAVGFLISRADPNRGGYIHDDSFDKPSRMHGHAYAVLFLSQVYGTVVGTLNAAGDEARLREVIRRGVAVIESAQTSDGGWGYHPKDRFDEASITVCCLQALRAAKDAGFNVTPSVIRRALRYLKGCAKPDGSFKYSLARNQSKSTYELTAAAISTFDAAGEYTAAEHKKGVDYMRRRLERFRSRPLDASIDYKFYGNLYAAQVFHQLGGPDWDRWAPVAQRQLIDEQGKDGAPAGAWKSRFGEEYATALALLILEVPLGFLPIFER